MQAHTRNTKLYTAAAIALLFSASSLFGSALEDLIFYGEGNFSSPKYIEAAIELQSMGEKDAKDKLRSYADSQKYDFAAIVLCRMLFEPKDGGHFRRPKLGRPVFFGVKTTDNAFGEREPICIVDGVPFAIVTGYVRFDGSESAGDYLAYCMENMQWTKFAYKQKSATEMQAALEKLLRTHFHEERLRYEDLLFFIRKIPSAERSSPILVKFAGIPHIVEFRYERHGEHDLKLAIKNPTDKPMSFYSDIDAVHRRTFLNFPKGGTLQFRSKDHVALKPKDGMIGKNWGLPEEWWFPFSFSSILGPPLRNSTQKGEGEAETKMLIHLELAKYELLAHEEKNTMIHVGTVLDAARAWMGNGDGDKIFFFRMKLPINIIKDGQLMKYDVTSDWLPVSLKEE